MIAASARALARSSTAATAALAATCCVRVAATRLSPTPRCHKHTNTSTVMSATTGPLSGRENLPTMSGAAAACAGTGEPPAKQQRLQHPQPQAEQPASFRVKLLSEAATPPKRGSTGAAGYDLARCV
jgi:hypothetical protein